MKRIEEEIWILSDGRAGTFSQGVGLAQALGISYKIIEVNYSIFAKLPNIFFSSSKLRLSQKTINQLNKIDYFPKAIISCGRRTAPVALYLQTQSLSKIKIIQIMNPNLNFGKFDFVILPKHDNFDAAKFNNVITTIGSLTKINQEAIENEKQKFFQEFENIKEQKIAILLGGSSNKTQFEIESAIKLAKISSKIANNMNASLIILNSRRTSDEISYNFIKNLNCSFKFFDWKKITQNPYLAVLGYADFFIVTGDSVSMISECASTGKPIYIFDEKNISSKKHKNFHKNLFKEKYASELKEDLEFLEKKSSEILNETQRVALLIKNRCG
ncbi:MAG: hypothetical protein FJ368_06580 [Pelagibacterales bacterium]|nr:hypothetical protein [Pelagibacterales bacterium]